MSFPAEHKLEGCARRLDPLNSYSTWVHRTSPTGVSNDAMGSVPNHPFWISVIDNLQSYARNWGFPYLTVMYSTGPLFISVIWKQWIAAGGNLNRDHRVRILRVDDYNSGPERFFNTFGGSSWHQGDVAFLGYVVENWFLFIILGSLLGAIGGWLLWGKVVGRKGIFGSRGLRWRGGSHKYRSTKGYGLVDRHEV